MLASRALSFSGAGLQALSLGLLFLFVLVSGCGGPRVGGLSSGKSETNR